ncbi:hypothetical protein ACFQWF_04525 [Methylorubrum suomiense]
MRQRFTGSLRGAGATPSPMPIPTISAAPENAASRPLTPSRKARRVGTGAAGPLSASGGFATAAVTACFSISSGETLPVEAALSDPTVSTMTLAFLMHDLHSVRSGRAR